MAPQIAFTKGVTDERVLQKHGRKWDDSGRAGADREPPGVRR